MCSSHNTSPNLSADETWKSKGAGSNRFYSSRPLGTGDRNRLESVYSCDSIIERINEQNEDDNDPYDSRTKAYLEQHFEDIGLEGRDAFQLYADLKVAEVLTRGTLEERKERKRLDKLKPTLPRWRIVTPDFAEAQRLINEIDKVLEDRKDPESVNAAFESIKKMINDEFNAETIQLSVSGEADVVEVRQLATALFNIMCAEEEANEKVDELTEFKQFLDKQYRPSEVEVVLNDGHKMPTHFGSEKLVFEERKCPKYLDSEDERISIMKTMIMLKKRIYQVLCGHVDMMKSNKHMMKMKLFRLWNANQEKGLAEMAADVNQKEQNLELAMKKLAKKPRTTHNLKDEEQKKSIREIDVDNPGGRYKYKRTLKCMRNRRKLLKDGDSFLSGVLNGVVTGQKSLEKVWPERAHVPGIPPEPPGCNRRAVAILNKCKESKKRLLTYGNLLRLLEQDDSFILEEENFGSATDDGKTQEIGGLRQRTETKAYLNDDPDVGCPFVTNEEFKLYMNFLNHRFFPDPNFKLINDALTFDKNAFMTVRPDSLRLNYSLDDLNTDTYQTLGLKGPQARAVYFFRYKTKFAAVDVQDAYERYVYENNAMDIHQESHPHGCLLLYSNVALGIVMIEGDSLHVFNHFAGFRYCPIMRMVKKGRILYVRERVSHLMFRQWISMIASPPPGIITYLCKTKKMLHRVAEPRVYHFREKLDRFYRIMSKKELDEKYYDVGEKGLFMAPNPVLMLEACVCCLKDGKELKKELHVPGYDLLPSPALVTYLLKYNKLKTINRFLDELFIQPELETEDETYHILEDSILSKYVDGVDEQAQTQFANKNVSKEGEIISLVKRDLVENIAKDIAGVEDPAWVKLYDINQFNPRLTEVQVKNLKQPAQIIKIDSLVDSDDSSSGEKTDENFVKIDNNTEKLASQRKFMTFAQTGSDTWQKYVKRFGLPGREIKKMMEDGRQLKKLRKLMLMAEKLKNEQAEGETFVTQVPSDEDEVNTDEVIIETESMAESGQEEELTGERGSWSTSPWRGLRGEELQFSGEWEFEEPPGEVWWHERNGETSEAPPPFHPEGFETPSGASERAAGDGSTLEATFVQVEGEEALPGAPPATSVSDFSTEP